MGLKNAVGALAGLLALLQGACGGTDTPPLVVSRVDVTPVAIEVNVGAKESFSAVAVDAESHPVLGARPTWSTSDPQVATVGDAGLAAGVSGGNALITATTGGITGSGLLTVNPIPSMHVSRSLEWYQTQMGTGAGANNNCGPTSTQMAIRWYRNGATDVPSVEEIRSRHFRDGGWWQTSDVAESLTFYGVPFATHAVRAQDGDAITASLQRGRVVLLCLEMQWIAYNRLPFYGRFYSYGSGHFLIVKGLSEDGQYFVVYDPNSWSNDYYPDQTAMGRNRYYKRGELLEAVTRWWGYEFEIGAPPAATTVALSTAPVGFAGPRPGPSRELP